MLWYEGNQWQRGRVWPAPAGLGGGPTFLHGIPRAKGRDATVQRRGRTPAYRFFGVPPSPFVTPRDRWPCADEAQPCWMWCRPLHCPAPRAPRVEC